MKKRWGLLLGLILSVQWGLGQSKFTISGYIKDSLSSETLIGATVSIVGKGRSVSSNQYGFFSITLPQGKYDVIVSFAGYSSRQASIELDSNVVVNQSVSLEDFGNSSVLLRIEHETRGAVFRIVPIADLQGPGSASRK